MTTPPRIDAHQHVWDLAVRDQPWTAGLPALRRSFRFDELQPQLRAHRIDATVLVQTIAVAAETPELLDLAATEPMVAGVVGWVDLTAADVAARLEELQASAGGNRLVGIRHPVQGEADPEWLGRPDVRRGLGAVAAAGLAYDLLITTSQLDAAIGTVTALPQLRFVLDHAAKPRIRAGEVEQWRARLVELARRENVGVKLSGLVTEADPQAWTVADLVPYADAVVSAFGADRIMFGSDWPVCTLATSYDGVLRAAEELTGQLSQPERDAVFGETAVSWYRLEPT